MRLQGTVQIASRTAGLYGRSLIKLDFGDLHAGEALGGQVGGGRRVVGRRGGCEGREGRKEFQRGGVVWQRTAGFDYGGGLVTCGVCVSPARARAGARLYPPR